MAGRRCRVHPLRMNITDVPFAVTDWSTVSATEHPGQIGYATWRTLITDLADDRQFVLRAGSSYQVASEAEPHRSRAPKGAKLFVVD